MSVPIGGPESGYPQPGPAAPGLAPRIDWGWIGESWNVFWSAAGIWLLAIVVYGIVNTAIRVLLSALFPGQATPLPPQMQYPALVLLMKLQLSATGVIVNYVLNWLVGAFQAASLYAMAVKQIRGNALTIRDVAGGGRFYLNMLFFNLLMGLLLLAGMLALCIGFFVAWAFVLIGPALVADGDSAVTALSRSFAAMKQDWLNGTLFLFVWTLVFLLSIVPCGLGLLVTVPMQYILAALAYRDMVGIPGVSIAGPRGYGIVPQYYETQPGSWPPAPMPAQPGPLSPAPMPEPSGSLPSETHLPYNPNSFPGHPRPSEDQAPESQALPSPDQDEPGSPRANEP